MFFLSSDLRSAKGFLRSMQLPEVISVFNAILNARLVRWDVASEFLNH